MRIIAGSRKGLIIKSIDGDSTRPTRDMVREALFSIISPVIIDSNFLDLFSGSGAIGIEALSRGADKVVFSDKNPKCVQVIKENIAKARFDESASVYNADYRLVLKKLKGSKFDLIFVDPPYNKGIGIDAISKLSEYDMLNDEGIIILETDANEEVPDNIGEFEKYSYKRYGRNVLNLFKRKG